MLYSEMIGACRSDGLSSHESPRSGEYHDSGYAAFLSRTRPLSAQGTSQPKSITRLWFAFALATLVHVIVDVVLLVNVSDLLALVRSVTGG